MKKIKNPAEFNRATLQFFKRVGPLAPEGEGAENISELFRSESVVLLYFHFLSGKPLMMHEVPLPESTAHRAKNVLLKAGLIKFLGTTRLKLTGPKTGMYRLVTR